MGELILNCLIFLYQFYTNRFILQKMELFFTNFSNLILLHFYFLFTTFSQEILRKLIEKQKILFTLTKRSKLNP